MIEFEKHSFGFNVFWTTFTGSAWPKALPASIVSALIHMSFDWILSEEDLDVMRIEHPYGLGVVFTAVGFLIVFRANHAYARLAEASAWLFHMETRLMDSLLQLKSFHAQSQKFKDRTEESRAWIEDLYHLHSLLLVVCCMALRRDDDLRNVEGYEHGKVTSTFAMNSQNVPAGEVRTYRPQSVYGFLHYASCMRSSKEFRALYHQHSKLEVYGGISMEECRALQSCACSKARVELVMYWLSHFITTSHLGGDLANVGPPIISRIYQWLSETALGYSKALRIVDVPFPFIIAQIAELAVLSMVPLVPVLHHSVVTESTAIGSILSFLTCLIFIGLYESARDVEDPFAYEPNDLPLVAIVKRVNESIHAIDSHPEWPKGDRTKSPLTATPAPDSEHGPGLIVEGLRTARRIIKEASTDAAGVGPPHHRLQEEAGSSSHEVTAV